MGKSYKLGSGQGGKKGQENPAFTNSFTNISEVNTDNNTPPSRSQPLTSGGGSRNGSAVPSKDEVVEMDNLSEEEKIKELPKEMQERVRNMPPSMRAAFLAMSPELRKCFKEWPFDRKMKILNMTPAEVKHLNTLSDTEMEEFFNSPEEEEDSEIPKESNGAAPGKGTNNEMMQKLQAMPSEMRQVFMNMSDKDRQKFIEMRKKAADWPEEKKKKMFQKMYKDYMKKQARDIMRARR